MRDHVRMLLELLGLPQNEIQVLEDTTFTGTLLYPNFFTAIDYTNVNLSDTELLTIMEDIVSRHLEDTKRELELIRTYKRTFYTGDDTPMQEIKA